MQTLAQRAVSSAISSNWKDARDANLLILKDSPKDVDALNRLAKAYFELGNVSSAKSAINKVLKIDPYNPIAVKCNEKWKNVNKISKNTSKQLSPDQFLEESGRTKIVHLVHPCDKPVIANLNCGDIVYANPKSHRVSIVDGSNIYIGKLPDDVSIKLKKHIQLGYEYVLAIKSIDKNEIRVFIREVSRPEKYTNISSFASEKIDYVPYTPPEMIHDKPIVTTLEEEGERGSDSQFSGNEGSEEDITSPDGV